jgi:hypothetical protein
VHISSDIYYQISTTVTRKREMFQLKEILHKWILPYWDTVFGILLGIGGPILARIGTGSASPDDLMSLVSITMGIVSIVLLRDRRQINALQQETQKLWAESRGELRGVLKTNLLKETDERKGKILKNTPNIKKISFCSLSGARFSQSDIKQLYDKNLSKVATRLLVHCTDSSRYLSPKLGYVFEDIQNDINEVQDWARDKRRKCELRFINFNQDGSY